MKYPNIIQEFQELVKIPVTSKNERKIADAVTKKLQDLGFTVTEDATGEKLGGNTGNLIAVLEGESGIPSVLFSAHLDRVKNDGIVPVINEAEGKITSDGNSILAADDVAGICAILDGIRKIQAEKIPHGRIEALFSVCEEIGVAGTRHLDFSQFKSKIAYVMDIQGKVGKIGIQAPTKSDIKIVVHGKSAHAGNAPEKGLSAIKVASVALARLREGRLSPTSTSNFGAFHAGSSTNVVCDLAEISGEARSTDDAELNIYLDEVKKTFADVAKEFATTIDVEIKTLYHTFHIDESEEVVRIAKKALFAVGAEPFCTAGGGGMDGNQLNYHGGIKTIGVAPGYANCHSVKEEIPIKELIQAGEVVKEIIKEVYTSAK